MSSFFSGLFKSKTASRGNSSVIDPLLGKVVWFYPGESDNMDHSQDDRMVLYIPKAQKAKFAKSRTFFDQFWVPLLFVNRLEDIETEWKGQISSHHSYAAILLTDTAASDPFYVRFTVESEGDTKWDPAQIAQWYAENGDKSKTLEQIEMAFSEAELIAAQVKEAARRNKLPTPSTVSNAFHMLGRGAPVAQRRPSQEEMMMQKLDSYIDRRLSMRGRGASSKKKKPTAKKLTTKKSTAKKSTAKKLTNKKIHTGPMGGKFYYGPKKRKIYV
jgi:hypothetical protein